ncbi:hypothetical protein C0991_004287 [Blastosporella zonata]|nr:hypothetical protein C0991_004287 [Blastosporella zonata]
MSSSSRSASPTLSGGLYIPVHKRLSTGSLASSTSSRTFSSSGSSRTSARSSQIFSSRASTSSESDASISPPKAPAFVYSRDTLLNLANSPLSRLPQSQRDALRGAVPEVVSNRKQRKAVEYHNHVHAVQMDAALRTPSSTAR